MISFECETRHQSFPSLKRLTQHCKPTCARVTKRLKTDTSDVGGAESVECWDRNAVAEFAELCEEMIEHTSRKMKGLPNDNPDWSCKANHLLAHYKLNRPFLEMTTHLQQSAAMPSIGHLMALSITHVLWCKRCAEIKDFIVWDRSSLTGWSSLVKQRVRRVRRVRMVTTKTTTSMRVMLSILWRTRSYLRNFQQSHQKHFKSGFQDDTN